MVLSKLCLLSMSHLPLFHDLMALVGPFVLLCLLSLSHLPLFHDSMALVGPFAFNFYAFGIPIFLLSIRKNNFLYVVSKGKVYHGQNTLISSFSRVSVALPNLLMDVYYVNYCKFGFFAEKSLTSLIFVL